MSTVKEFITSSLEKMVEVFNNIQCRYQYDSISDAHYIEILPSRFFKESKELKRYRGEFLDRFYQIFNDESIVFITEGSLIKITDPEFSTRSIVAQNIESIWMNFERNQALNIDEYFFPEIAGPFNYALAA